MDDLEEYINQIIKLYGRQLLTSDDGLIICVSTAEVANGLHYLSFFPMHHRSQAASKCAKWT